MKFQSAEYASVFLAVHPVQPLRLNVLLRLRKLGISSSDKPSDSAVPLFLLPLFHPVSQSPVRLAQFTFSSLSSSPICFQSVTQCSDLSAYLPLVCIPVAVCLSFSLCISLLIFLSASSGHKCLRHCTRVLDTQVVISPSQEQVHAEVRG